MSETALASLALVASGVTADLLADIEKAKARVERAEAALERAEARDPEGIRDEVSACRQILTATLNLLYEEEKRLTAGTAGVARAAASSEGLSPAVSQDGLMATRCEASGSGGDTEALLRSVLEMLSIRQKQLNERLPAIEARNGSELNTDVYDEFGAAMLPPSEWGKFYKLSFESIPLLSARAMVLTFSQNILGNLNQGNVKEVEHVQPESLRLLKSILESSRLREKAFVKKEVSYHAKAYRIDGRVDKTVRINDTGMDLMCLEDKMMTLDFSNDVTRNKAAAQALSQINGFAEKLNNFLGPRRHKFVSMFCGLLTNGLQWIFLHMRWDDHVGQYLIERTAPICVISKHGESYEINSESVTIVTQFILQSISVAEEVWQQYQSALDLSTQISDRNDAAAGDDNEDSSRGKPRSRGSRHKKSPSKNGKTTKSTQSSSNGKTTRSFGAHLTLNDVNLRLYRNSQSI